MLFHLSTREWLHEPTWPEHGDLCISGGFPAETMTATATNHDRRHKPYGICWSTQQGSATEQPSEGAPRPAPHKEPARPARVAWGRQGAPSSSGSATEQPLQAPPRAAPTPPPKMPAGRPLEHLPQGFATEQPSEGAPRPAPHKEPAMPAPPRAMLQST